MDACFHKMNANNLTISVPNKGCDKNCNYCISKITGDIKTDEALFSINLSKVQHFAKQCGVSSVLITGKGEPFLSPSYTECVCLRFSDYILEVQTNGLQVKKLIEHDDISLISHFNIIAFSLDDIKQFEFFKNTFEELDNLGIISRVTMNVTNNLENIDLLEMIYACKTYKVRQFSLRDINYPKKFNPKIGQKEREWIDKNNNKKIYQKLVEGLKHIIYDGEGWDKDIYDYKYPIIRKLPFGAIILDIDGISFTHFDYCVQESSNNEEIRSLIYQEDGHLYTSWNSKASIIF
jgi:molybdenum cofactor biosynthesis enzyme MoaA